MIFIVALNPQLRKNLKSAFSSNFDFLGTNTSFACGTNSSQVPVNKLQKYLKLVSQKLGTLQFSSPNHFFATIIFIFLFQVKKLIVANLKNRELFPYLRLGFHQNHPYQPQRHTKSFPKCTEQGPFWLKITLMVIFKGIRNSAGQNQVPKILSILFFSDPIWTKFTFSSYLF